MMITKMLMAKKLVHLLFVLFLFLSKRKLSQNSLNISKNLKFFKQLLKGKIFYHHLLQHFYDFDRNITNRTSYLTKTKLAGEVCL